MGESSLLEVCKRLESESLTFISMGSLRGVSRKTAFNKGKFHDKGWVMFLLFSGLYQS